MYDYKAIPQFVIKPATLGNISITHTDSTYYLHSGEQQFMCLNTVTNREIKEQYAMYDVTYGDVLLTGFGFGILPLWVASKPEVTSVTVVELSKEVVDLFLQNNQLPDKVNIEYADAKTYTTDKHYDCLILDHYPDNKAFSVYDEVTTSAKNIPHDLLWFYQLEGHYVRNFYDIKTARIDLGLDSLEGYDFYTRWQDYRNSFKLNTFPTLDKETLDYYIKCYFDKLK